MSYIANQTPVFTLDIYNSWKQLTEEEKLYVHYLSQHVWATFPIAIKQRSVESFDIFVAILKTFRNISLSQLLAKSNVSNEAKTHFENYIATFLSNGGNYRSFGDVKFIPGCSKDEFIQMMFKIFNVEGENDQIVNVLDDIYEVVDGKGLFNRKDGKLNFKEFYQVISLLPEYFVSPVRSIAYVLFRLVDSNNSGDISSKEMKNYFNKIGIQFKSEAFKRLMNKLDINNNSQIEFDEFAVMFQ